MVIRILAVRLRGGSGHEHINLLRCMELERPGIVTDLSVAMLLEFVESGGMVELCEPTGAVIFVSGKRRFLQASVEGQPTDDLLKLPRF